MKVYGLICMYKVDWARKGVVDSFHVMVAHGSWSVLTAHCLSVRKECSDMTSGEMLITWICVIVEVVTDDGNDMRPVIRGGTDEGMC